MPSQELRQICKLFPSKCIPLKVGQLKSNAGTIASPLAQDS